MTLLDLERRATLACLGPAPSASELQALGDPRIWALYREMIRNRLRRELKVALRRSHAALGEAFEALFERHLEHSPPRSRPFHGIVDEFATSAVAELRCVGAPNVPAFTADLIAYEAALWAVSDLDDRVAEPLQELSFEAIACFTPARRMLALKHAVHEAASPDGSYRAGDVWLCVYRKADENGARTFVLNATSYALVEALQTGELNVTQAVQRVAAERRLKLDAAFIDGLCTVLADFVERGVLLGSLLGSKG